MDLMKEIQRIIKHARGKGTASDETVLSAIEGIVARGLAVGAVPDESLSVVGKYEAYEFVKSASSQLDDSGMRALTENFKRAYESDNVGSHTIADLEQLRKYYEVNYPKSAAREFLATGLLKMALLDKSSFKAMDEIVERILGKAADVSEAQALYNQEMAKFSGKDTASSVNRTYVRQALNQQLTRMAQEQAEEIDATKPVPLIAVEADLPATDAGRVKFIRTPDSVPEYYKAASVEEGMFIIRRLAEQELQYKNEDYEYELEDFIAEKWVPWRGQDGETVQTKLAEMGIEAAVNPDEYITDEAFTLNSRERVTGQLGWESLGNGFAKKQGSYLEAQDSAQIKRGIARNLKIVSSQK